ncbi:MAG: SpoIID/LytB domain-containing protein [Bacteroidota bacterium]|nr:SpoIID/LytB domain-containing protein [Bacteroidota bacterium]
MKSNIFLFLIILFSVSLKAENVRVRIYTDSNVKEANFGVSFGNYTIEDKQIKKNNKLRAVLQNGKVSLYIDDNLAFSKDTIKLISTDAKCFFQITPTGQKQRRYDNNLEITTTKDKKSLLFINDVEMENYIAGVVQSEAGGASDNVEFFKVQAICCRTYMQRNMNKHQKDGYNLCDQVNCQVYFSRANKEQVIEGSYKTAGEIIVDEMGKPIETLFHSNSGGQTVNAEAVWGKEVSYLKSIVDSFSIGQPNYVWEKDISEKEWLNYFKNKGIDVKDYNNKVELLNFSQEEGRKDKIFDISLVQIRKDFKLKSTFFSVVPWGSSVKLKGKGYGHGVGLSQEGAAKMCEEGYEYWQVIEHYYTGVKIKEKQVTF